MKIVDNIDDCERLEHETADQGDHGGDRLEDETADQIDCERLENETADQVDELGRYGPRAAAGVCAEIFADGKG